jgi:metal-responsive CopG/Arc/MetJ family transcriptional regulator
MKYRIFSICLPEDLIRWLDEKARSERRSRNQLIKVILEDMRAGRLIRVEQQPSEAETRSEKPPALRLRRAY